MIIGVDIDDTVADLMSEWLRWWNLDHEKNIKPSQIKQWDISKYTGKDIFDYLVPGLYNNVKPIKNSLSSILQLRLEHRVVFVTAFHPKLNGTKFEWLNKNGFNVGINDYIECSDKSLINTDILIDDGFHNITAFNSYKTKYRLGILFERSWNEKESYSIKTKNWETVVKYLGENKHVNRI